MREFYIGEFLKCPKDFCQFTAEPPTIYFRFEETKLDLSTGYPSKNFKNLL